MALTPGTRLGVYEVTAQIGVGGMGQVYRAMDTTLGRQVAIKILPDAFAADPERMARFEREAKTLALLNHPNISAIYAVEKSVGLHALVMELVEGEDLSERIERGAIPLDEALPIAKQIAEALEAAHEQGIIHRDLKPANVKVRPDGTVKVLDFGLAKAMEPTIGSSPQLSQPPTITTPAMMTGVGIILGTAAYMSPEQAKGRAADRRADVWAFGCVLYEMLTGQRAFEGDDVSDTLARILMKEPDWSALAATVPAAVVTVMRRCLQKDRKQRLRDIGDASLALDGAFETAGPQTTASATSAVLRGRLAWMAAFAVAVLGMVAMAVPTVRHLRETPPAQPSGRFNVLLAEKSRLLFFMLSPDGRHLAFISDEGGPTRLWVRPIDALDARPISGTDDAAFPFWSPDGRNLGFFAEGKLKKIALTGGPAQTLCDAPTPRGGTWNRDGVIVFAPNIEGALFRVPEAGGGAAAITTPAPGDSHRYPEFILGGNRFLFTIQGGQPETSGIYVGSLDGATPVRLLPDASHAVYVPPTASARTGAVLFYRETTVMALPVDVGTLRATGAAVPIVPDVGAAGPIGFAAFSASDNGLFLYRSGDRRPKLRLVWLDRSGMQIEAKSDAQRFASVALSPDGKKAAYSIFTGDAASVWLQDLEHGAPTKFTVGPEARRGGVWSPDGRYLVFSSVGVGHDLFRRTTNSAAPEELLLRAGNNPMPLDISPDGKLLVYSVTGGNSKDDLWLVPLQGDHTPEKYLDTPFEERQAQFSPDGQWMAYSSDESGQFQVYVQPVPTTGFKRQISTQGGSAPRWRRDGKELYYLSATGQLTAVPVMFGAGMSDIGAPQRLFERSLPVDAIVQQRQTLYQPSADGQKFLALVQAEDSAGALTPVTIWLNWMVVLNK